MIVKEKKRQILNELVRITTDATLLKSDVLKKGLRRNVSKQVYIKQAEKLESRIVKATAPLFKKQVKELVSRMEAMAIDTEKSVTNDAASGITASLIDQDDKSWTNKLKDRMLPIVAVSMLEAAKAQMIELGLKTEKSLDIKYNPNYGSDGRFSSGTGGGAHLAPDTGGGTGGGSMGGGSARMEARKRGGGSEIESVKLHKKLKSQTSSLNKEEQLGEELYIGSDYWPINTILREGGSLKEEEYRYHKEVEAFGKRTKVKIQETITYRGLDEPIIKKLAKEAGEGGEFEAKGFVSTSLSINIALGFAFYQSSSSRKAPAVMEIKTKTGRATGEVDRGEFEITQAPGTKYKYLGKETHLVTIFGEGAFNTNIYMFEEK